MFCLIKVNEFSLQQSVGNKTVKDREGVLSPSYESQLQVMPPTKRLLYEEQQVSEEKTFCELVWTYY